MNEKETVETRAFGGITWIGKKIEDELGLDASATELDSENMKKIGILIVKVGNDDRPASDSDIKNVSDCLEEGFKNLPTIPFTIVTHHAIDFSIVYLDQLIARDEKDK
jgi:hypothetical protein